MDTVTNEKRGRGRPAKYGKAMAASTRAWAYRQRQVKLRENAERALAVIAELGGAGREGLLEGLGRVEWLLQSGLAGDTVTNENEEVE